MAKFVFTYSGPAEPQAITVNQFDSQKRSGDILVDADIAEADEGVKMLVYLASTDKPTASLFGASSGADPSDGLGGGYLDGGTISMPTTGPMRYFDLPDGLTSASYKIGLLPTAGGDSDVVEIGPVTIDSKAPTLASTSPVDEATGVSVTTSIVLTFDKAIYTLTGTLTIRNITDDSVVATITVLPYWSTRTTLLGTNNWRATVNQDDETITIYRIQTGTLPSGKEITVEWTDGAFGDEFSNPVAENSDVLFSFTTA